LDPSNGVGNNYARSAVLRLTDGQGRVSNLDVGWVQGYGWSLEAAIPQGSYTATFECYNDSSVKVSASEPRSIAIGAGSNDLSFYCRAYDPTPTALSVGAVSGNIVLAEHGQNTYNRYWKPLALTGLRKDVYYLATIVMNRWDAGLAVSSYTDAESKDYHFAYAPDGRTATFKFAANYGDCGSLDLLFRNINNETTFTVLIEETAEPVVGLEVAKAFISGVRAAGGSDRSGYIKASLSVQGLGAIKGCKVRLSPGVDYYGYTPFGPVAYAVGGNLVTTEDGLGPLSTVADDGSLSFDFYYRTASISNYFYSSQDFLGDVDFALSFLDEAGTATVLKRPNGDSRYSDMFFVQSAKVGAALGDGIALSLDASAATKSGAAGFRYFTTWGRAAKVEEKPDGSGGSITILVPPEAKSKLGHMVPDFAAEPGAVVTIGSAVQSPRQSAVDFTKSVTYVVTSEDGSKIKVYTVIVKDEYALSIKSMRFYLEPYQEYQILNDSGTELIRFMTDSSGFATVSPSFPYSAITSLRLHSYGWMGYYGNYDLPVPDGLSFESPREISLLYCLLMNNEVAAFSDLTKLPSGETAIPAYGTTAVQDISSQGNWFSFVANDPLIMLSVLPEPGSSQAMGIILYDQSGRLVGIADSSRGSLVSLGAGYRFRVIDAAPRSSSPKRFKVDYEKFTIAGKIGFQQGEGFSGVKGNLNLPAYLATGEAIGWSSDSPAILGPTGIVKRPDITDAIVTLRASYVVGGQSIAEAFSVAVKAVPAGGEGGLSLSVQAAQPCSVTLGSNQGDLGQGQTMSVWAYSSAQSPIYYWYLDDILIPGASSQSVQVGTGLMPGRHSVFVIIYSADGFATDGLDFSVLPRATGLSILDPAQLSITISGLGDFAQGNTIDLWCYGGNGFDSYAWYLDGSMVPAASGSSFTLGKGLAIGRHSLLVVGKIGAMQATRSYSFSVTEPTAGISAFDPAKQGIYIYGMQSTLALGSTMQVSVSPVYSPDLFIWFVDGVPVASGANSYYLTIGQGLALGRHSLMVMAKNGSTLATKSGYFTIQ
jgi:hypothetical protein